MCSTFVERRQEVGTETDDKHARHDEARHDSRQDRGQPDSTHTEVNHGSDRPLEELQEETVVRMTVATGRGALRLTFDLPGQQQTGQDRRHRQRDQQRRENRHDVGHAQRSEQPAFDSGQCEQRHEHEDHQHRAEHDARPDFDAGVIDHVEGRLGLRQPGIEMQTAEDVFDVHDRVIHQFAHRDGQPAQCHDVD